MPGVQQQCWIVEIREPTRQVTAKEKKEGERKLGGGVKEDDGFWRGEMEETSSQRGGTRLREDLTLNSEAALAVFGDDEVGGNTRSTAMRNLSMV